MYDDFYRLKTAKAIYQGEFTEAKYELNMSYNNMHNIVSKNLVHTVNEEQKGYVLDYNYDNPLHPNAPNTITETGKPEPRQYVYDGNGNPTSYTEHQSFRKMTWDEENRLMGINDNGRIHQYTYDANGERVIKSSGGSQHVSMNGETAATIMHTDDYTGYVSRYFVISKGKFTKHYFEGAGRIVSKLGNGAFAQPIGITAGGVNYTQLTAEQQMALDNYVRSLGVPPGPPTQQGIYASPEFTGDPYPPSVVNPVQENEEPPQGWPRNPAFNAPGDVPGPPVQFGPPVQPTTVPAGEGFTGTGLPENDIFFYHPDHLGSTSYITDKNGSVSQHVEYIAFGEVLFEEHNSSYASPYLFNGKELDREINLSYYGARYLDMKTSLWLNVDPLASKFPSWSPYSYAFNNPIRFIDPDGMEPTTEPERKKAVETAKEQIGTPYGQGEGKLDCSALVDKGTTSAGITTKKGKGVDGWANGVALIVGNSRKVNADEIREGDLATFKSGRSDHKGKEGEFDHIGIISKIGYVDGKVAGFNMVHAGGSGVKEVYVDLVNGLPGYELKNFYQWDTPDPVESSSSNPPAGKYDWNYVQQQLAKQDSERRAAPPTQSVFKVWGIKLLKKAVNWPE